jgi:hypothetical protein
VVELDRKGLAHLLGPFFWPGSGVGAFVGAFGQVLKVTGCSRAGEL